MSYMREIVVLWKSAAKDRCPAGFLIEATRLVNGDPASLRVSRCDVVAYPEQGVAWVATRHPERPLAKGSDKIAGHLLRGPCRPGGGFEGYAVAEPLELADEAAGVAVGAVALVAVEMSSPRSW